MTIDRSGKLILRQSIGQPLPCSAYSARPPAAAPSMRKFFSINGRFLAQPLTGVQRYGREIVHALDSLLPPGIDVDIAMPASTTPNLATLAIRTRSLGPGSGHLWEQLRLPMRRAPLLNLCNTAPVFRRNRIVCIHDANVFDVPESYSRRFRLLYKALHPLIARSAAILTTVSRHSAERIARHLGLPADQIVIIPNSHEHALRWQPDRAKISIGEGRPYILLLGSLAKHKNIQRILGLANALDTLGLDIKVAGSASSVFVQQPQRSNSNVSFLGAVTDDDLASLMTNALCLAFPSLSEGFGIPMLEAMIWRCPVVASRATSLPDVGGDACLFANPHCDVEWLKHFTALRNSMALQDELRGGGRERTKMFSWTESAARYLELMTCTFGKVSNRSAT